MSSRCGEPGPRGSNGTISGGMSWAGLLLGLAGCAEATPADADPCGEWPEDERSGAIFVAPGGDGGGAWDDPMGSVASALDAAAEAGLSTVRVATGTYAEALSVEDRHAGLEVAGRCRDGVTIDATEGWGAAVRVDLADGAFTLRDLTTRGGRDGGVAVIAGSVTLGDVAVEEPLDVGVGALGAEAELIFTDLAVARVRAGATGAFGAIRAQEGARVSGIGCVVSDVEGLGLVANGGQALVEIEDCEVIGTTWMEDPDTGEPFAQAVYADDAGMVLRDVVVSESAGISAFVHGAALDWTGGGVHGVDDDTGGTLGIVVDDGAVVTLARLEIAHVATGAVQAGGAGTTVTLVDTTIRDLLPYLNAFGDVGGGYGLHAYDGATVQASGVDLLRCTESGVLSWDGATVDLADVDIRDTRARPDGDGGIGIAVQGATLTGRRVTIAGSHMYGAYVTDGGTLELTDADIRETAPWSDGRLGYGLTATEGGVVRLVDTTIADPPTALLADAVTLELDHVTLSSTTASTEPTKALQMQNGATGRIVSCDLGDAAAGLQLSGEGTYAWVEDTRVHDVGYDGDDAARGVGVQVGARLDWSGGLVEGVTDVGVVVSGVGSRASFDAARIERVGQRDGGGSYGVAVQGGAALELFDTTIADIDDLGLFATGEGSTLLVDGGSVGDVGRGSTYAVAVGVNVQGGASGALTGLTLSDVEGPGLTVLTGGSATCDACTITGNGFAGIVVTGATAVITGSTLSDNGADANEGGGVGLYAETDGDTPVVTLERSTVGPHPLAAVWFVGPGDYEVHDNALAGGLGVERSPGVVLDGDGVVAVDVTGALRLEGNTIVGAVGAGVLLHGSSASLSGNVYEENQTDLVVQACAEGAALPEGADEAPVASLCARYDLPLAPMSFDLQLEDVDIEDAAEEDVE